MGTLITIRKSAKGDTVYDRVSEFASAGYRQHYNIELVLHPDMFVYAEAQSQVVGCFGAYYGSLHHPLTTEWYVDENNLKKFVGGEPHDPSVREALVEIGTRVVHIPPNVETNSVRISVAMTAVLLLNLFQNGKRVSLFTADRSVQVIARQLGVNLVKFGSPDLTRRSTEYQEKWKAYFNVPRECFGVDLYQASHGCRSMCEQLIHTGFAFESVLFAEEQRELLVAM